MSSGRSFPLHIRHAIFLTLLFLPLFLNTDVRADWPADGLPVCADGNTQTNLRAISDDYRGLFLVWQDYGGGLYAQHVDADGNALWVENGVPVGRGSSFPHHICTDGDGELWITGDDGYEVFVEHLDSAGNPDFPDGGYPASLPGSSIGAVCAPDDDGGIIIAWINDDSPVQAGVWAARIDGTGNWDSTGMVQVGSDVYSHMGLNITTNAYPGDGVFLAWTGWEDGYVQWVDTTLAPRWNGSTGLYTGGGAVYAGITDRQKVGGGAYAVFVIPVATEYADFIVIPVSADGTFVDGGVYAGQIESETYKFSGIKVIDNGVEGILCTWGVLHRLGNFIEGIYARNFDYDSTTIWGPNRLPGTNGKQIAGWDSALKLDTSDLLVSWQVDVDGVGRLQYSVVDRATGVAAEEILVPGAYSDAGPRLVNSGYIQPDVSVHPLAAWIDTRNPSDDIYANSLSADWPDTNVVGLYTSGDPATAAHFARGTGPLTVYLCVKDYQAGSELGAWECSLDLPANVFHTGTSYFGSGVNAATPPEYMVGCNTPLPISDFMVLAEITLMVLDSTPAAIFMHPVGFPCLPGQMALLTVDEPGICKPMEWVTGNEDEPVFYINDPVAAVDETPPQSFRLHANVPNPFNPRTTIRYDLPAPAQVSLTVYDLAGRRVNVLQEGASVQPGRHDVTWDGRDDSGRGVSAGVYLYRLKAGNYSETRRMVLVK